MAGLKLDERIGRRGRRGRAGSREIEFLRCRIKDSGAQDVASGESTTVLPGFGFAIPNRAIELLVSSGEASRMVAA